MQFAVRDTYSGSLDIVKAPNEQTAWKKYKEVYSSSVDPLNRDDFYIFQLDLDEGDVVSVLD